MQLGIPKKLSHIWIGPLPPPTKWMETWRLYHPNWEYRLFDNEYLKQHTFKTREQISEYLKRGQYAGVADLMRLEILYMYGGFMPEADSICMRNTEELFDETCAYTVYENEFVRGKLVSPIQACEPGNVFVGQLIDRLSQISPEKLDEPWISTGNLFTAQMIEIYLPKIRIFPSHYLIPVHFTGVAYTGSQEPYAVQLFATTQSSYHNSNGFMKRVTGCIPKLMRKIYNRKRRLKLRSERNHEFIKKFLCKQQSL